MSEGLRVVFFGRSQEYSLSVLDQLRARHLIVGIVESRWGRGNLSRRQVWIDRLRRQPSLAQAARRAGVPHYVLTRGTIDGLAAFLAPLASQVGAICSLAQLLPRGVIECFPRGILNLHPSLLPRYRGPSPLFWEFWHREEEGGVTIHFIDEGEDTGDIVGQSRVAIPFGADGEQYFKRLHHEGARLLAAALDQMSAGTLQARPQRHLPCPFRARYVKPGEAPIDWTATPIEQVFHVLRGLLPFMDLLPPAPMALRLLAFRADSFERGRPLQAPSTYVRRGARIGVAHAEGHLWLRPVLEPFRAARVLRQALTTKWGRSGR